MDPATMAAIASAAGPVIGKLFGGGPQEQRDILLNEEQVRRGQREADRALTTAQGFGPFTGENFAGMTPDQIEALRRSGRFADVNQGLGQSLIDQGSGLMQPGMQIGANAQSLFDRAMSRDPAQARERALSEATGSRTQELIDAATRDASRVLNEQTLPGIQQGITETGNRNSSRAGAAEAVARRGTSEMIADTSANIRQGMFDSVLNDNSRTEVSADQAALGANSQLGTSLDRGLGLTTTGLGAQAGLNDQLLRTGTLEQQQQQAALDAERARYDDQRFDGFNVLDRYNQGIGGPISVGSVASGGGNRVGNAAAGFSAIGQAVGSLRDGFGQRKQAQGPNTAVINRT